jgi:cell filamentation protein
MADPYVYPGTETLINKLNIRDSELLQSLEGTLFAEMALLPLPKGQLDLDHLKALHKHYFGDIYDWAGQIRSVDISKGESFFARKEFIGNEAQKIFNKLKAENYLQDLPEDKLCEKLSYYFNELNAVHPFREGNGRTLRAFCSALADRSDHRLNWKAVTREEYIHASICGFKGDYVAMEKVFQKIAQKIERSQDLSSHIILDKSVQKMLKSYVEKEVQFFELVKQKNSHLSQPDISKEYANKAFSVKQEIKKLAQKIIKHETVQRVLKSGVRVSLRDQGGFETVYNRLKKEGLGLSDSIAILREAYSVSQNESQSPKKILLRYQC